MRTQENELGIEVLKVLRNEYPDQVDGGILRNKISNVFPDLSDSDYREIIDALAMMGLVSTDVSFQRTPYQAAIIAKYRITPKGIAAIHDGMSFVKTPSPSNQHNVERITPNDEPRIEVNNEEKKDEKQLDARIDVTLAKSYEKMEKRMLEMQEQIDEHEATIGSFYTKSIELFAAFVGIFSFIVVYLNSVIPNLPGSDALDKLAIYSISIVGIFIGVFFGFFYLLNRFVLKKTKGS